MSDPSKDSAATSDRGDAPVSQTQPHDPRVQASLKRYWRSNITLMAVLLGCWAVIGLGCGVLFADWLNQFRPFGGFPLGFWFAQQGSIIGFVLIILIYALAMNRLDKKHHKELTRLRNGGTSGDVSGGVSGGTSGDTSGGEE